MSRARVQLGAAFALVACSSTTTAIRSPTDASADVPVTDAPIDAAVDIPAVDVPADAVARLPTFTGTCRWSLGDVALVSNDPNQHRVDLLDAVATEDGAVVAWRDHDDALPNGPVHVRRVGDDGNIHDWSAPGRGSRTDVATLATNAPIEFSMVWDAPRQQLAMLVGGESDHGPCVFVEYGARDVQRWQPVDLSAGGGFPRDGCGALQHTVTGWSLLTTEVRALWGNDLVALADDGHALGATPLPMTASQPQVTMTRSVVTGGFVATWTEPVADAPGQSALHLRRFDAAGLPRGADHEITRSVRGVYDARIVEIGGGLLALWRAGDVGRSGSSAVLVRALSADGTPRGPEANPGPYGLDAVTLQAVARGDEVLAAVGMGLERKHLMFASFDASGAVRGEPLGNIPSMLIDSFDGARVVPTRRGALLFVSFKEFGGGGLLAFPMDCLP